MFWALFLNNTIIFILLKVIWKILNMEVITFLYIIHTYADACIICLYTLFCYIYNINSILMYTHCLLILLWFHLFVFSCWIDWIYIFIIKYVCPYAYTRHAYIRTHTYARLEHFTFNVCMYIVFIVFSDMHLFNF